MSADEAARTHKWYNITSNKKAGKVTASVMIYGEIGWEVTAKEFVKELTAIEADSIEVHINSVGGDVFDGVAIYNALRMHDASVIVYVEGLAASAASFIAQAGDEVIMLRGSEMMIHDASAFAWGNEAVMLETAGILGRISNNVADIYAQRAGGTAEEWRAVMQAEMWYNPQEAVDAGLADTVLEASDEDAVAAKASWDLKVFNFAGRKDAPSPAEETLKIINRVKETPMGATAAKTQAEATTPPATEPPAPAEAPENDPVEVEAEAEGEGEETPPVEAPAAPAAPVAPVNRAGTFTMRGVQTTDQAAVQAHINELEAFYDETRSSNRTSFIASLAEGEAPKILATQITAMEELVATMSDKQYEMWVASWDAAPSVGLLQPHASTGGGQPSGTAAEAAADRVEVLKGIVTRHQMASMHPDKIKATDSYKELTRLQPDFTL